MLDCEALRAKLSLDLLLEQFVLLHQAVVLVAQVGFLSVRLRIALRFLLHQEDLFGLLTGHRRQLLDLLPLVCLFVFELLDATLVIFQRESELLDGEVLLIASGLEASKLGLDASDHIL